jgi:hypothetical protein
MASVDPVTAVNFALSLVIVALAVIAYSKKKQDLPLYVGVAFGLFGLSHLLTLAGLANALTVALIIIRTLAYLTIILALIRLTRP